MSGRYRWFATLYDAPSLERPVYRPGRVLGVELLRLARGASVLDVGCGTGLSFPLVEAAIGPGGLLVGVDASREMIERARRRVERAGRRNVVLVRCDAAELDGAAVRGLTPGHQGVDAVLATYAPSVIARWEQAWDRACAGARPGARVAVVDLGVPDGPAAPLGKLAALAGGADPERDPGRVVLRQARETSRVELRGGHVVVTAGTTPRGANDGGPSERQRLLALH